jgi:ribonuclease VapC
MIAADTSALVAIVLGEAERMVFRNAIRRASKVFVSTVSAVELKMVVYGRRGPRGAVQVESLLALQKFEITPPSIADMEAAFAAFVAFGKGSGHPAALNFGDLFSYALAKVRGVPLLFKGSDFAETDILTAVPPPPLMPG